MHLANYQFQPDEELQKTQAAMAPHGIKNGGLGIIITVLALCADFYQVSYFLMYTNCSSELAFLNAAFIVLGLDVSMFCLANNVNKAQITKKGFRDKGFLGVAAISIGIFIGSYIAFLLLATSVMAANKDSVYGFQLLFPALTVCPTSWDLAPPRPRCAAQTKVLIVLSISCPPPTKVLPQSCLP